MVGVAREQHRTMVGVVLAATPPGAATNVIPHPGHQPAIVIAAPKTPPARASPPAD